MTSAQRAIVRERARAPARPSRCSPQAPAERIPATRSTDGRHPSRLPACDRVPHEPWRWHAPRRPAGMHRPAAPAPAETAQDRTSKRSGQRPSGPLSLSSFRHRLLLEDDRRRPRRGRPLREAVLRAIRARLVRVVGARRPGRRRRGDRRARTVASSRRQTPSCTVPDFRLAWSSAFDLGWKAAAVNLADIAAMGARPTALLVALAIPDDTAALVRRGPGRRPAGRVRRARARLRGRGRRPDRLGHPHDRGDRAGLARRPRPRPALRRPTGRRRRRRR